MDRVLGIEAFARVAQTQSFAEAARQLRLSESGHAFFRDCNDLVARTNAIVDPMREVRAAPAGLLRVHALTGFVLDHLAQPLGEFQGRSASAGRCCRRAVSCVSIENARRREHTMRNIDEHTISEAFLQRLDGCDSPRLKQIMASLVTHLHDFAREVRLTEAEWMQGIDFLTRTGRMCDDKRQEFILLSDTLGLSMLVVALNNAKPAGATEATVLGPFHVDDAPAAAQGADIAAGAPGRAMDVAIAVQSIDGTPLAGATVDVWQADEEGLYDVQRAELETRRARASMRTDAEGRLRFRTVLPTAYPVPTDGPVGRMLVATGRHPWRPAHLHFLIKADGHETLVTHLFRDGDPYLDSDVVFGVRNSLVVSMGENDKAARPALAHTFVLDPIA